MTFFGLFGNKKKQKENSKINILKDKIYSAGRECKRKSDEEKNKKEFIEDTANKMIAEIYYVPEKYWYEELKYFDIIKNLEKNKEIDAELREKTEKILSEYLNEKKICEAKIELYEILAEKYEKISERIEKNINERKKYFTNKKKIKELEKFKLRLEKIKENNFDYAEADEDFRRYIRLDGEISEIEDDLKIKKEVELYINGLTDIFANEENESFDADMVKTVTENIKKELDK